MGIDDSHKNPIMNAIDAGPQNELRLLREAECYMLASHFFWGLWAVVNAPVSSIPFGYWVILLSWLQFGPHLFIYLIFNYRSMPRPGLQLTLSTNKIYYVNMEKLSRRTFNSHLESNSLWSLLPCCFPIRLLYEFRTETHSNPMHAALYYLRGHRPKASLLRSICINYVLSLLFPLLSKVCISRHMCRFFLVHFLKTLFLGCDLKPSSLLTKRWYDKFFKKTWGWMWCGKVHKTSKTSMRRETHDTCTWNIDLLSSNPLTLI
jgi:hypothetical protein